MRTLVVIGIGAGNPEHMTIQGINALNRADIVLIPRKGAEKDDLADLRREICRRYLTNQATKLIEFDLPVRDTEDPDYRQGVDDWHDAIAETYRALFTPHSGEQETIALLVWGDPSLYDSTLRIVERLRRGDFAFELEVIPGITSLQALTASHRILLNSIGNPIQITTGRQLRQGFPPGVDSVAVMLDGGCAFRDLPGDGYDIYWGAYLGTADEIVISGRLSEVSAEIERTRTKARDRKGWIMDIYLLRRISAG
jgi:precorrin-6A synthase